MYLQVLKKYPFPSLCFKVIILEGINNDTEHYQFQEIYKIYFLA